MSAEIVKKEGNIVELKLTQDAKEFAGARKKAYQKKVSKIEMPGFRKGKVPQNMFEQIYGYYDAVNVALPDLYDNAVEELDIYPVAQPDIDVMQADETGLEIKAIVVVKPEVSIGKYKGVKIKKGDYKVTAEDINTEIDKLKQKVGREVTIEKGKVQDGDKLVIDFKGFIGDEAFEGGEAKDSTLIIGSGSFIPGFEEALIGKKLGEECKIDVTFPEEYHADDLKGKDAVFEVKVNEIKRTEYPEIDDEFAKDVSEFDTLKELKADLKAKLQKDRESQEKEDTQNLAIEEVVKLLKADIPKEMIDSEIDRKLQQFESNFKRQGLDMAMYLKITNKTLDELRTEFEPQALNQVKANLAIDEIIRLEKLEVTPEEVEEEYKKFLDDKNSIKLEDVKKYIPEESLKEDLQRLKAVELLVENAKIS